MRPDQVLDVGTTVYVLLKRYDADATSPEGWSVTTVQYLDKWGDGEAAWERTRTQGVFSHREAIAAIPIEFQTGTIAARAPQLTVDLVDYIHRCVIPIEWQHDYGTDRELSNRVTVYFPMFGSTSSIDGV